MNNQYLIELDRVISDLNFFSFLKGIDIDEMLDMRDEESFDNAWMKDYNIVENKQNCISKNESIFINRLRETAYKNSYAILENSDLSGYISDDIELIAKSVVLNLTNSWAINYLWNKYLNGESPVPVNQ